MADAGLVLGLDTATAATAVAVLTASGATAERRHEPAEGERPGHATRLLALAGETLAACGADLRDVDRIAVGCGPGGFTGLRIGIATARALAQATGAELAGVSTLAALATGAGADAGRAVLAVIDARRGEAFAAAWHDGRRLGAPAAVAPDGLSRLADPELGPWLAVGDGATRYRARLADTIAVPEDDSPLHRVSALTICRLGRAEPAIAIAALVPQYVREPDAVARR